MKAWISEIVVALLLAISGCSSQDTLPDMTTHATGKEMTTVLPAAFINKVWIVAESEQVAPGGLRVFLSDGTLVMASPHTTPALGTWAFHDGRLTIVEKGQKYDVEVLELNKNTFRIRIHGPGDSIDIRFKPAG